jgi:hypothetical protein
MAEEPIDANAEPAKLFVGPPTPEALAAMQAVEALAPNNPLIKPIGQPHPVSAEERDALAIDVAQVGRYSSDKLDRFMAGRQELDVLEAHEKNARAQWNEAECAAREATTTGRNQLNPMGAVNDRIANEVDAAVALTGQSPAELEAFTRARNSQANRLLTGVFEAEEQSQARIRGKVAAQLADEPTATDAPAYKQVDGEIQSLRDKLNNPASTLSSSEKGQLAQQIETKQELLRDYLNDVNGNAVKQDTLEAAMAADKRFSEARSAGFKAELAQSREMLDAAGGAKGNWNPKAYDIQMETASRTLDSELADIRTRREELFNGPLSIDNWLAGRLSRGPDLSEQILPSKNGKISEINLPENAILEISPLGPSIPGQPDAYKMVIRARNGTSNDPDFAAKTIGIDEHGNASHPPLTEQQIKALTINASDSGTNLIRFVGGKPPAGFAVHVKSDGATIETSKLAAVRLEGSEPSATFADHGQAMADRYTVNQKDRLAAAQNAVKRKEMHDQIKELKDKVKHPGHKVGDQPDGSHKDPVRPKYTGGAPVDHSNLVIGGGRSPLRTR